MFAMSRWPVSTPKRSYRRPILKANKPTTVYSGDVGTLCPRCHERSSVLAHSGRRPQTSTGYSRLPTPLLKIPADIEDRPDSAQPSYVFGASEAIQRGGPLTYVPELKSWVSNAVTDYEKSTIYQITERMNRGFTPNMRSRSMSPTRTRPFFGRSLSHADGFGYPAPVYGQSWNPYGGTFHMASHLQGASPMANYTMYPQSGRQSRPSTRHMRRGSLTKGYVHDLSCFQSTQPMVTGHFVIHPDWVSERMTPRATPRMTQIQY